MSSNNDGGTGRPHLAVYAWMATVPFATAVFLAEAGTADPWMTVWACIKVLVYMLITAPVLLFLVHWADPKLREVAKRV